MTSQEREVQEAITALLYDHGHGDYESSAAMLAAAISDGKVPGVMASGPPCIRMCEAQAVKLTMAGLRAEIDHNKSRLAAAEREMDKARDDHAKEVAELRAALAATEKEWTELRDALEKCAAHVGGYIAQDNTHRFHLFVEDEVRLVVERLRKERDRALGLLREARDLIPANMQYRNARHVDQWYDANDDLRGRIDALLGGGGG